MTTPQTNVVGIFEDRTQADHAVTELQRAGFRADEIMVGGYDRSQTDEARAAGSDPKERGEVRHILVTVWADHRYAEALSLLRRHGAQGTQHVAR